MLIFVNRFESIRTIGFVVAADLVTFSVPLLLESIVRVVSVETENSNYVPLGDRGRWQ